MDAQPALRVCEIPIGSNLVGEIWSELSGKGRYFQCRSLLIPASIDFVEESLLCTTLRKDGHSVRTVEHLLLALEGTGVDNCRIEIMTSDNDDPSTEVPIFDGSAREWVEAIEEVGLTVAMDSNGRNCDKLAPYLTQHVNVPKGDFVIAAFPSKEINISYGINFPQVNLFIINIHHLGLHITSHILNFQTFIAGWVPNLKYDHASRLIVSHYYPAAMRCYPGARRCYPRARRC